MIKKIIKAIKNWWDMPVSEEEFMEEFETVIGSRFGL